MVGPRPLDGRVGQFDLSSWTADSLPVLWGIPGSTVGAVVLATTMLVVVAGLLMRDDDVAILLGFTVVALAFFTEPTRVHERYLFPAYLTAAVLAGGGLVRVAAYVVSGVLTTINLHGILGTAFGSVSQSDGGGPVPQERVRQLPWSSFGRAPWLVDLIAVAHTVTIAALLAVWLVVVRRRPARTR